MPNPVTQFRNSNTRLPVGPGGATQVISDTKWSQKILALGAAPVSTDFFTSAPNADRTIDNYDAGNQLVTSGKSFTIQGITVNVISATLADIDNIIQRGTVVLTAQGKEIGAFRVRNLCAAGGTYVAGAQVAAANTVGVTNGLSQTDMFRVSDLTIETNQSFKATLVLPSAVGITLTSATTVEIGLHGYEARPAA